ncbi:MAG: pyridoxal phosphate-dependent aminotransferase [Halarsenatibacteraceae bacterium]
MLTASERVKNVAFAGNRVIFEKAKKLESAGKRIIHMEVGRPDFDSPESVKEAAIDAIKAGKVHYTSNYGLDELRDKMAEKLVEENGIDAGRENIIVTPGAMMALSTAILGVVDTGDEVLIPSPYYPSFYKQVQLAGGKPVVVPTTVEDDYQLSKDLLDEYYTDRTKLLVLNSPNNPTGAIQSRESMKEIAEFARDRDIFVISDECYEKFLYQGEHISIGSLPGMDDRTLTVNSTSKTYSMTGWRIGFLAGPEEFISEMVKVPQNMTICPTSFAQYGSLQAYDLSDEIIKERLEIFKERRDIVVERLAKLEQVELVPPAGGLYAFPKFVEIGMDAIELCDYLLEEAGIAVVPGGDFGPGAENSVRIAFTCSTDEVREGMDKLVEAVQGL